MVYLHAELASYDLPHGNLKTGNVLLAPDFEPILTDYGLIPLVNPSAAPNVLFAFKSPESPHVSPKSDVYCFGIVLIEILTSRFP
ncbi:pollen receptor-like kinase 3, partial [Phalaenopsis equestris]